MTRSAKLIRGSIGAWTTLVVLHVAPAAGMAPPAFAEPLVAGVAGALAAISAVLSLAAIWRGPELVSFARGTSALCDPEKAEIVRTAARIRGTMGGGGHLHPARLILSAVAWGLAAAVAVVMGIGRAMGEEPGLLLGVPPTLLVATAAAFALAIALPAKPFVYRELTGGGVIVYPRASSEDLLRRARPADQGQAVAPPRADPHAR